MFKKLKSLALISFMLVPTVVYGQTANIDTSKVNNGIVDISYKSPENKKTKVMVAKGSQQYTYDLDLSGQFPLQLGEGEYVVSILENASSNKYKLVTKETIKYNASNPHAVYLQSIEMINWNNQMKAVKKANELTKGLKTDKEKAQAIYNYVTNTIKYDYNKAATVQTGYIPSVDSTLNSASGICFDYSVLYAAMMRSVGIPTKMIMGTTKNISEYHA